MERVRENIKKKKERVHTHREVKEKKKERNQTNSYNEVGEN